MSLILRLRQQIPNGFIQKPYFSSLIGSKTLNPIWACRNYGQPALKEWEEEIEEELGIDPRKLPADYDPASFDPSAHRSPPNDRVFRLVDEISCLTLDECSKLGSIMMKKMEMSEPPVMGVLKPGLVAGLAQMSGKCHDANAQEEKKEEKTVFELKLEAFDSASKIKVIKEIRGFTDLGLKEAKDLVEKSPAIFKKGVSKEEAEQIVEKMKAVGAKVVME